AGVEAVADREIGHFDGEIPNRTELLEARANQAASTSSAFEQERDTVQGESFRSFGDSVGEVDDSFFDGLALVTAWMRDQILGSDGRRTFQFAAKTQDRFRANGGVDRSQIYQVVIVDNQRF